MMGLRPHLSTRRAAGVASTTLALLLSTAAAGVVPAAAAGSAAPGGTCVEPADVHADARVKPGGAAKHEPNELTAAQVRDERPIWPPHCVSAVSPGPARPHWPPSRSRWSST